MSLKETNSIAIFDVCGTLYDVNTTTEFMAHLFKRDKLTKTLWRASHLLPFQILNAALSRVFNKDILRLYFTTQLKGREWDELDTEARNFVWIKLSQRIKQNTANLLTDLKTNGYRIILMSGSYDILVKHIADYFNVDEYYASNLEHIDNILTGKYKSDLLGTKHQLLDNIIHDPENLIVVSDNKSDRLLMAEATIAYIICSNNRAKRYWKRQNIQNGILIK